MMMAEPDKDFGGDFDDLERLFAQGRCGAAPLPEALQQRILADADRVQAGFSRRAATGGSPTGAPTGAPTAAPGFWAQFLAGLGGWPAMGGLVTACAAGVWIGLAPPAFLPDPAQLVLGVETEIDLMGMGGLAAALAGDG